MKKIKIRRIILVIGIIVAMLAPNICFAVEPMLDETENNVVEEYIENEVENNIENESDNSNNIETDSNEIIPQNLPEEENSVVEEEPANLTTVATQAPVMPVALSEKTVEPGSGTLQQALLDANEGDILILKRGTYTGGPIIINKSVTIRGAGSDNRSGSVLLPKIKVEGTNSSQKIVLENVFLGNQQSPTEENYKFIDIQSPANVTINNVICTYIYRGGDDVNPVIIEVGSGSGSSEIDVKDSYFVGSFRGICVESSNNNITLDKTTLIGKLAFVLNNGTGNTLNVKNNSKVTGRSQSYTADEAIQIIGQKNLTINITDSEIIGNDARGDRNTHIFSLDGNSENSNVLINITGNSVINDINPIKGSTIFNFGQNNTPANNNVVKIGKNVKMTPSTVEYKYNVSEAYAVVGIYDKDGNATVKTYEKDKPIPEEDYNSINSSSWYKVTNSNSDFDILDNVSENMDIYPTPKEEQNITVNVVVGEETESYTLKNGQTYKDNLELKTKLEELKSTTNKTFSNFVSQDETIIDENTKIYKDTTITPKYKVTVTIKDKDGNKDEYQIEQGQNLSYISQSLLDEYEKETNGETKIFSRYVKTSDKRSISKSIAIDENIEIEPIYYVTIKVNVDGEERTYNIDEGKSLNDALASTSTLIELKRLVNSKNKVFKCFEDEENTQVTYDTALSKHTKLTAKYKIKVTIYNEEGQTQEYEVEEGQNLKSLGDNVISEIESFVQNGKDILKYIDGNGEEINFEKELYENTSFEPIYDTDISVTVKGQTYRIKDGENLNALGEEKVNEIKEKVKAEGKDLFYFTNSDGEEVNFDTPIYKNTELTPVYKVTVKIEPKNEAIETIDVKEGTTFEELSEQVAKYNLSNKHLEYFENKENSEKIEKNYKFEKHTTIVPKYTITVTVNTKDGEEVISGVDENSTLESLAGKLDKFENVSGKHLEKYVNENNDEVEKNKPLTENIKITPRYYIEVTINGETYRLSENGKLNDLETEQLNKIRDAVKAENKTFSHFVDEKNSPVDFDTTLENDTTLSPKYKITVKIVNKNGETILEQTISEEDSLDSLGADVISKIKEDVKVDKKVFAEKFINEENTTILFSTKLDKNMTLTPKYNVEVTINGNKYTLEEGKTLNDLKPDELTEIENSVNNDNKKFAKEFKNENGEVVNYTKEIWESTTLTPQYNVEVTIKGNVYTLKEGQCLNDLGSDVISQIEELVKVDNKTFAKTFANLKGEVFDYNKEITESVVLVPQYNITVSVKVGEQVQKEITMPEGSTLESKSEDLKEFKELTNKAFVQFVKEDGTPVSETTALTENTTIKPQYNITVSVKVGEQVQKEITMAEGSTLESKAEDLKEFKEVTNKTFVQFVKEDGTPVSETTALTENTTIKPQYNITVSVKVGEEVQKEITMAEGSTLERKAEDLKEFKEVTNKTFVQFVKEDGTPVSEATALTENTTIKPQYNITVSVKVGEEVQKEITMTEGSTLASKAEELKEFKELTNKTFVQFVKEDGTPVSESTALTENTTIIPKYEVEVKIGNSSYTVDEGTTLKQLIELYPEAEQKLENIKDTSREFSRFVDEKGNTVNDDISFNENTTITPKYNIKITVKGDNGESKEFVLEEGKTLNDLSEEYKQELEKIKNNHPAGLKFVNFKDVETGEIITDTTQITGNITLEAVYEEAPVTPEDENNTQNNNENNPKTGDNLLKYIILAIVGLGCMIMSTKSSKRKNNTHRRR